jgi:hypothetical protein
MNDLVIHLHDRNRVTNRDRQDNPAGDPKLESPQKHRRRGRWGGRLFAFGGFVSLAGGLSLGAWGNHSQQQEAIATAKQAREFVPSLRVATIEPSPGTVSVTLPGTTAAFAAANIYARATGYIDKRNVDIGDRVKAGDLLAQLAVPELDDQISQNEATLDQLKRWIRRRPVESWQNRPGAATNRWSKRAGSLRNKATLTCGTSRHRRRRLRSHNITSRRRRD